MTQEQIEGVRPYQTLEIEPNNNYKKIQVQIQQGYQRKRPYDECYLLRYDLQYEDKGGISHTISGLENNSGFDCNYRREWKTLAGVIRFIEKKLWQNNEQVTTPLKGE